MMRAELELHDILHPHGHRTSTIHPHWTHLLIDEVIPSQLRLADPALTI